MWSFIKKIGWRVAASYYWIHFLAWIFGFGIEAIQFEQNLTNHLESFLLSTGAAPINPTLIPIIIKIGWFLFITEFKPSLMIGFFLYVFFFPILLPFIIYSEFEKSFKSKDNIVTNVNNEVDKT